MFPKTNLKTFLFYLFFFVLFLLYLLLLFNFSFFFLLFPQLRRFSLLKLWSAIAVILQSVASFYFTSSSLLLSCRYFCFYQVICAFIYTIFFKQISNSFRLTTLSLSYQKKPCISRYSFCFMTTAQWNYYRQLLSVFRVSMLKTKFFSCFF